MEVWLNQYWQSFRTVYAVPGSLLKVIAFSLFFPALMFVPLFAYIFYENGAQMLDPTIIPGGRTPLYYAVTEVAPMVTYIWILFFWIGIMGLPIKSQTVWQKNATLILMMAGAYIFALTGDFWFDTGRATAAIA